MQEQEAFLVEKASQVVVASCSLEVVGREVSGARVGKMTHSIISHQLLLSKHIQKHTCVYNIPSQMPDRGP